MKYLALSAAIISGLITILWVISSILWTRWVKNEPMIFMICLGPDRRVLAYSLTASICGTLAFILLDH